MARHKAPRGVPVQAGNGQRRNGRPVAQLVILGDTDVRPPAASKNSRESAPANRLRSLPVPERERQRERRAGAELAARAARLRAALKTYRKFAQRTMVLLGPRGT